MKSNFKYILIIGPSSKRKGGIASVLSIYKKNFDAQYFDSTKFQSTFLSFLFFPERLISLVIFLLINKEVEIIHIHGSHGGSFYRKYLIYKIGKLFNKKIIYHIHSGTYHEFYMQSGNVIKQRIDEVLNHSEAVIVLANSWKEYFKKNYRINRIFVLNNIVDLPIYQKGKNSKNNINIIFMGKIFKEKGIYELLDCITLYYEYYKKNNVRFTVAGNGDEDKMAKYKNSEICDIVNFPGWIDTKEKNELLGNADILILPSFNEGLPISILEAMSYGLPIIATNVGGIPRVVKDRVNGVLIKPGSVEQIKNAIELYIQNPTLIKQHGVKSLELVEPYYPENVFKKLESIYSQL